jgi:hypothetical protein
MVINPEMQFRHVHASSKIESLIPSIKVERRRQQAGRSYHSGDEVLIPCLVLNSLSPTRMSAYGLVSVIDTSCALIIVTLSVPGSEGGPESDGVRPKEGRVEAVAT